jgi:hypothetical protein
MNEPNVELRRTKVTLSDMQDKIKEVIYMVLPETTTTVCIMTMKNGYSVLGTSACVDHASFNKALGEQYSYNNAIDKLWPLEGYLLADQLSK